MARRRSGAKANHQPTTREAKHKFRELKNERTVLRDFLGERANQVARTSRNHGSRSDIVEEHRALMALVHSVPYDAEKYRFAQQQKAQRKAQSDAAAALAKTTALPPWEDKTALLKGEDETVPSRHSSPDTRAHAHDQQNQVRSRRSVSYTPPDNAASILALKSEEEEANAKEKAGKRIAVGSALSFSPNDLIFTQY
ncbi:hypothetical protein D0869_02381 [Hortaea werneckii]|uniref:Uncharacterized protein n=1 Tax=Hortaea werneckii TaxID=91943 RepID=A0A3M7AXB9_HORWE|nr:hypothetical protein KC334_g15183 [Hortaea werneckii]KAI6946174.1 hypothetical protein KC355_g15135 [Hortaea werneckii]KAI7182787.1 hypothetical protein KC324_g8145 [Hortaea werneckii]KAI7581748.1 hypothetical protein KC316_g8273 [Hortaea werneckii]KAI7652346.1 hypothetical protein KC318_g15039 [Hortaea werneckii]